MIAQLLPILPGSFLLLNQPKRNRQPMKLKKIPVPWLAPPKPISEIRPTLRAKFF
jgi:hypothetical protein